MQFHQNYLQICKTSKWRGQLSRSLLHSSLESYQLCRPFNIRVKIMLDITNMGFLLEHSGNWAISNLFKVTWVAAASIQYVTMLWLSRSRKMTSYYQWRGSCGGSIWMIGIDHRCEWVNKHILGSIFPKTEMLLWFWIPDWSCKRATAALSALRNCKVALWCWDRYNLATIASRLWNAGNGSRAVP